MPVGRQRELERLHAELQLHLEQDAMRRFVAYEVQRNEDTFWTEALCGYDPHGRAHSVPSDFIGRSTDDRPLALSGDLENSSTVLPVR